MKTLRQVLDSFRKTKRLPSRSVGLFEDADLYPTEEQQYNISINEVQNGSIVSIRYDTKQGESRRFARLCAEGEDPLDHIRQLIALAKLET